MADASQNGELQEVIRKGRMPEIRSVAVFFYSNTTRNLETLIITDSSKISRQLLHALSNKLHPCIDPYGRDDRYLM